MSNATDIYEYYNGTQLGVNQDVFIELSLLTYAQFQKWCQRKKLRRLRTAGNGRIGLIAWSSIPENFIKSIKKAFGDPYRKDDVETFIHRMDSDSEASVFFEKASISEEKLLRYYVEAQILNLYGELLEDIEMKSSRNSNFSKGNAKKELAKIIGDLKTITLPNGNAKYPHKLPSNPVSLQRKYNVYKEEGYASLIHGGTGNDNTKKIKGIIADFLLAKYALPHKPYIQDVFTEYMAVRKAKNWPALTEDGIYKFLNRPEHDKYITLGRHGKDEYVRKYGHKVTRDKSDWFPNAYLGIDGTKLDWIHYKEDSPTHMGADIKIDVVFDIYSEKILGWHFTTEHENHAHHFAAFKMAMQESGKKPALITYDNQSGHKTTIMQDLYDKLVTSNGGEHYPHRAYEHGSPVEQLFSRFQQQVLNKMWFSDKQAITVRKADSRPNMEFVKRHRDRLKPIDELKEAFSYCVEKWNAQAHPKFATETRDLVYSHEQTYKLDTIGMLDMMQLFWVTSKDAITYNRDGITPTITKTKYHYEVYDADGRPDLDFRDKYTGSKFFVQYDPDQMDNYVRLYLRLPDGSSKYIADAQPVKAVKGIPALMDDQDRGRMHKMVSTRDTELERMEAELEALRNRTGIDEETLIEDQELELKYRGRTPKKLRALAESEAGSWLNKL